MLIHSTGGNDFLAMARRLRQAGPVGKQLRRDLTKHLTAELAKAVEDVQDSVRKVQAKGSRGGGARARGRFDAAGELRRVAKAEAKGKTVRARRRAGLPTGLRQRIARGVKARVQYSGYRYGAQIVVSTSHLPQSQRSLPRHLNNPQGWRHPVFGNREAWVGQRGEPWFDRAIDPHIPRLRRVVRDAVNDTMRKLR